MGDWSDSCCFWFPMIYKNGSLMQMWLNSDAKAKKSSAISAYISLKRVMHFVVNALNVV